MQVGFFCHAGSSNVATMGSFVQPVPFSGIGIQQPGYIQLLNGSQSALMSQSGFVPLAVPQNFFPGTSFSPTPILQPNQQQYVYSTGSTVSGLSQFVSYPPPTAQPWLGGYHVPPPGQPVYLQSAPSSRPQNSTPMANPSVASSVDKKSKVCFLTSVSDSNCVCSE